jgi:hypothetical protein
MDVKVDNDLYRVVNETHKKFKYPRTKPFVKKNSQSKMDFIRSKLIFFIGSKTIKRQSSMIKHSPK